jgi:lariat debranching enzyme
MQSSKVSGTPPVDLLLICGDFQCVRYMSDFDSVAVPAKYRHVKNFQEYVTGKKVAPVMTIFIGGNHEASNILQSLYYGGFVAPNIYFLGFAGVVWYGGVRISGLSGIFNESHYRSGRFEYPPYTDSSVRSVYHLREVEVYRMAHLKASRFPVDIFLSHDWPAGIVDYGNRQYLLRKKPYFREDVETGKLGSPPLMNLLQMLRPSYWFSAHLHVKFMATVQHPPLLNVHQSVTSSHSSSNQSMKSDRPPLPPGPPPPPPPPPLQVPLQAPVTRFLALDKVLPGRQFIEFLRVPRQRTVGDEARMQLSFDLEWLAVLRRTHGLTKLTRSNVSVPDSVEPVSDQELAEVEQLIRQSNNGDLTISNIEPTGVDSEFGSKKPRVDGGVFCEPVRMGNSQTDALLGALGLNHICTVPHTPLSSSVSVQPVEANSSAQSNNDSNDSKTSEIALVAVSGNDPNEISLDDD